MARWYDDTGARKSRAGFETKTAARDWLDGEINTVAALRSGDVAATRRQDMPTLSVLVDEYLAQHTAEANTLRTLRERLKYAVDRFGDTRVDRLDPQQIGAWRKKLPARSAWGIHKALRQLLHYAVRVKLIDENVAVLVPNPEPKRREVPTFQTVAELGAISDEL